MIASAAAVVQESVRRRQEGPTPSWRLTRSSCGGTGPVPGCRPLTLCGCRRLWLPQRCLSAQKHRLRSRRLPGRPQRSPPSCSWTPTLACLLPWLAAAALSQFSHLQAVEGASIHARLRDSRQRSTSVRRCHSLIPLTMSNSTTSRWRLWVTHHIHMMSLTSVQT